MAVVMARSGFAVVNPGAEQGYPDRGEHPAQRHTGAQEAPRRRTGAGAATPRRAAHPRNENRRGEKNKSELPIMTSAPPSSALRKRENRARNCDSPAHYRPLFTSPRHRPTHCQGPHCCHLPADFATFRHSSRSTCMYPHRSGYSAKPRIFSAVSQNFRSHFIFSGRDKTPASLKFTQNILLSKRIKQESFREITFTGFSKRKRSL